MFSTQTKEFKVKFLKLESEKLLGHQSNTTTLVYNQKEDLKELIRKLYYITDFLKEEVSVFNISNSEVLMLKDLSFKTQVTFYLEKKALKERTYPFIIKRLKNWYEICRNRGLTNKNNWGLYEGIKTVSSRNFLVDYFPEVLLLSKQ